MRNCNLCNKDALVPMLVNNRWFCFECYEECRKLAGSFEKLFGKNPNLSTTLKLLKQNWNSLRDSIGIINEIDRENLEKLNAFKKLRGG